jgi:hypothetical protein
MNHTDNTTGTLDAPKRRTRMRHRMKCLTARRASRRKCLTAQNGSRAVRHVAPLRIAAVRHFVPYPVSGHARLRAVPDLAGFVD